MASERDPKSDLAVWLGEQLREARAGSAKNGDRPRRSQLHCAGGSRSWSPAPYRLPTMRAPCSAPGIRPIPMKVLMGALTTG